MAGNEIYIKECNPLKLSISLTGITAQSATTHTIYHCASSR
jgi:hypothetical protein